MTRQGFLYKKMSKTNEQVEKFTLTVLVGKEKVKKR